MNYISTRCNAPVLGFCDALLCGLARDGGLYIPEKWPVFEKSEIAALAGRPYSTIAYEVIKRFVDDEIDDETLNDIIAKSYQGFHHAAIAPLVQIDERGFVLELFHGPTLAFKDLAMQLLSRLMDHILSLSGARATIIGATSGDTGGAAIEAFKGRANTDIFILFPHGRVSPVQRRQMTTISDENVHALAIDGSFDDCQSIVKAMFTDLDFRDRVSLSGINSINWGRIVAQIVYYFSAATALGTPHRSVSFTVPTGNFGDIFAGYAAKKMGLSIDRLVIATNQNDILARTLETGHYCTKKVEKTISPSMDIQVSSNFERLLFDLYDRNGTEVRRLMENLKHKGSFTLSDQALHNLSQDFHAERSNEQETRDEITSTFSQSGYMLDPHTAVGRVVARKTNPKTPIMITLGTAHPAKFPDVVQAAIGKHPELPRWAQNIMEEPEMFEILPNDIRVVEAFVEKHSRAACVPRRV